MKHATTIKSACVKKIQRETSMSGFFRNSKDSVDNFSCITYAFEGTRECQIKEGVGGD